MQPSEMKTELLVVGGGVGGVAAAITAARLGMSVVLTEVNDWLGGQMTSQAVPPDEHEWIESARISPSYSELRDRIRSHYRDNYPLTDEARRNPYLNPGAGFVSRLCHEPRVAELAIRSMLSPLVAAGLITVLQRYEPVRVERTRDRIEAIMFRQRIGGDTVIVSADRVIDATELGDVLALGQVAHVIGAESQDDTGELHAPALADPLDQQAVTWCAALEYRKGEDHTIAKPASYDRWKTQVAPFWPGSQLSWNDIEPISLRTRFRPIFQGSPSTASTASDHDLWHYRRILATQHLDPRWAGGEVTLVNWPQVDYWDKPLLGVSDAMREVALDEARGLTLSFIHWMQTEAPRSDGGVGYPELRLRGDAVGTTDGLAQAVYVRESRRIRALFTVTEAHIGKAMRERSASAVQFHDSVGVGYYRIDLHPSTAGRTYVDIDSFPFQIPLGALIPVEVSNLIAGAKNIGTTHITNGAYRLHPVEWSIGEAAGALAVFCSHTHSTPERVRENSALLAEYQRLLTDELGISLTWKSALENGPRPLAGHGSVVDV